MTPPRNVRRPWRLRLTDGRDVVVTISESDLALALAPAPAGDRGGEVLVATGGTVVNPRHVVTAEPLD